MECNHSPTSPVSSGHANSECSLMSLLILPKALDSRHCTGPECNSLENTLARANAWLNCSHASGVPILFVNVQAETFLTRIIGEEASCVMHAVALAGDVSPVVNTSLYGFEEYDIAIVRAVRLWYTPAAGERALEIKLHEGDAKLGFAVSRTDEGFLYISSVSTEDDDRHSTPACRSGLSDLYAEAAKASRLLVISRVADEKVLPKMVSPCGAIRCFDTVSLSRKLSLHRYALRPISLHFLMWDAEALLHHHHTVVPLKVPDHPHARKQEPRGRDAAGGRFGGFKRPNH